VSQPRKGNSWLPTPEQAKKKIAFIGDQQN
jgi:hypothetical protein